MYSRHHSQYPAKKLGKQSKSDHPDGYMKCPSEEEHYSTARRN